MTGPTDSQPKLLGPELLATEPRARLMPVAATVGALALTMALGIASYAPTNEADIDLKAAVLPPAQGHLATVDLGDSRVVKKAIAALRVRPQEKEQIEAAVQAGELHLGVIRLSDYMDADGDVVIVSSAGFTQNVPLAHEPTIVVIPYSGPGAIALTGLRDGGGGITVAVSTMTEPVKLSPMFTGETIQVTIP